MLLYLHANILFYRDITQFSAKMINFIDNPWNEGKKSSDNKKSDSGSGIDKILDGMGIDIEKMKAKGKHSNGNRSGGTGNPIMFAIKSAAVFLLLAWLSTGFYVVEQDQESVIMRLGKYNRTSGPGLRWKFPNPIETVDKVSVTRFSKVVIGVKNDGNVRMNKDLHGEISNAKESQMLTADENIIDLHFFFQWKIKNSYDYLFNIRDAVNQNTIRMAGESAMREVIGTAKLYDALSDQRQSIEQTARSIMQEILDSYGAGVEVVSLGILYSYVAPEVRDAYRDVQSAKADKETAINKAYKYRNAIIPQAQGEAKAVIERAMSYKAARIAEAEGESSKFAAMLNQYKVNKGITKNKMYIDTMKDVYSDIKKIVIEPNKSGASGVLPILGGGDLLKHNDMKIAESPAK